MNHNQNTLVLGENLERKPSPVEAGRLALKHADLVCEEVSNDGGSLDLSVSRRGYNGMADEDEEQRSATPGLLVEGRVNASKRVSIVNDRHRRIRRR